MEIGLNGVYGRGLHIIGEHSNEAVNKICIHSAGTSEQLGRGTSQLWKLRLASFSKRGLCENVVSPSLRRNHRRSRASKQNFRHGLRRNKAAARQKNLKPRSDILDGKPQRGSDPQAAERTLHGDRSLSGAFRIRCIFRCIRFAFHKTEVVGVLSDYLIVFFIHHRLSEDMNAQLRIGVLRFLTECLIMVFRLEREVPAAVPVARLVPLRPAINVSWTRLLSRAGLPSG